MAKKKLKVEFSFCIKEDEGYNSVSILGISFSGDAVPAGKDPVEYLRERVIFELDRRTLEVPAVDKTVRLQTIKLPGYEAPKPEPEPEF